MSDFTFEWSVESVEDSTDPTAKYIKLTVDSTDPAICTFSGTQAGGCYNVNCDVYYEDCMIWTMSEYVLVSDNFYVLEMTGYNDAMDVGESCTVTPSLTYYDASHRSGVKKTCNSSLIFYGLEGEYDGCTVKENSNGTFTITQTADYSYVTFYYSDDYNFIYADWNGTSQFYDEYEAYYNRLSGANRYETAVETARELWYHIDGDSFSNIVIASGTNFPDALAGCPLAVQLDAPILLAGKGNCVNEYGTVSVNSYAYDFIEEFAPGATIWILGGASAVPVDVETTLEDLGHTVNRLAGYNRYATDMEIINAMEIEEGTDVVIVRGYTSYKTSADAKAKKNPQGYADSLSVSGIAGANGMPIFLADKDGLTDEQLEKIEEIDPENIYIIGGESAVSVTAEQALTDRFGQDTVERIAGTDRYDTSVKIAQTFGMDESASSAVLACGTNFPDGLTGGVLAAQFSSPVILVDPIESKNANAETFAANSNITYFNVCGGKSAVKTLTVDNFAKQILDH